MGDSVRRWGVLMVSMPSGPSDASSSGAVSGSRAGADIAVSWMPDPSGSYRAIPSAGNARYLLPVSPRSSWRSLAHLSPATVKHRVFGSVVRYGPWQGTAVEVDGAGDLTSQIADMLGCAVSLSFIIGTEGAYQKVGALIWNEADEPVGFAKIAATERASEFLRNEADTVERLGGLSVMRGYVPSALGVVVRGDTTLFVQTVAPRRGGPQEWSTVHERFLARVEAGTGRSGHIASSGLWRYVLKTREFLEGRMPAHWTDRLDSSLDRVRTLRADKGLRLATAHRDFAPWNTRLRADGELFVFDWEFSMADYPAGFDSLHFAASLATRARGVIARRTAHRKFVRQVERLGVLSGFAYLLDTSLFYLAARARAPHAGSTTFLDWLGSQIDALQESP